MIMLPRLKMRRLPMIWRREILAPAAVTLLTRKRPSLCALLIVMSPRVVRCRVTILRLVRMVLSRLVASVSVLSLFACRLKMY